MSEMKDNGETGSDSQDLANNEPNDVEIKQEELPHSKENQNPSENGHSLPEVSVDKNLEFPTEAQSSEDHGSVEPAHALTAGANGLPESKSDVDETGSVNRLESAACINIKVEDENGGIGEVTPSEENGFKAASNQAFPMVTQMVGGDESGTEEEQAAFMKELENFFRERSMEFKPPKFYGVGLNCLKLWRAVTGLGGYDRVLKKIELYTHALSRLKLGRLHLVKELSYANTSIDLSSELDEFSLILQQVTTCKLWRQVGESFKPPKTCTTVSWSFRGFYEKALLDYERHKIRGGELCVPVSSLTENMSVENQVGGNQASGSGRARRDAAARAMQGWHSQRLLGNGEVGDPIIKDKNPVSMPKREKQLKSIGMLKRKKPSNLERAVKAARTKAGKPQMDDMVVDIGPPADWVKINVRRTKDCFEVYALVPGLLREEVRVQSDPAGRLVISGEPEQPDNPWGVTPFKKVISLASRIDPHQTSAVVTLHGQLFVRVPFEQSDL